MHELKSAFAKAIQEPDRYILPIRLDKSEVPGLSPNVGYLSTDNMTVEKITGVMKRVLEESK